ncbi:hypothetical protein EPUS_09257 [Endocarpon pusillum Z07020]|uniref:Uncharacterized protein n=1 Tax=Endocarpon pusillum (strain Z07020 / HMAS-L-300199) TaxID=1263415 RepID=U1G5R8_ENDPU|nr:uncharacterized protein EPUS_09257 [Endocarpon pusillum Z07020]ERF72667.1 hypothetical protein EPUS_09257 [Endocarpon pusillum Z07020]
MSPLQHCLLYEEDYIQGKSALISMANQARFLARVEVILEDLFILAKQGSDEIETLQVHLLEAAGVKGLLEFVAQIVPKKIMNLLGSEDPINVYDLIALESDDSCKVDQSCGVYLVAGRNPAQGKPVVYNGMCNSLDGGLIRRSKCGRHTCTSCCHQLYNHSKILCGTVLTQKCSNGHNQSWQCHTGAPPVCSKCERDRKEALNRAQRTHQERLKREEKLQRHLKEVAKLDEEMEQINQSMKDARLDSEQMAILAQKRMDLAAPKQRANRTQDPRQEEPLGVYNDDHPNPGDLRLRKAAQPSPGPAISNQGQHSKLREHIETAVGHNKSPSQREWQRQKDQENAHNPATDKIMEMIGLEHVKAQVLKIKAKVETTIRLGTDLSKERLGLVLLGKTTFARYYARVLTTMKVLVGAGFIETTGSHLAHGVVTEVKNHLVQLEKLEGGVYFIDEAYQLAEGHNHGGKTVLDYLLANIENLTGKIVFIFAGYRKEIEKFFEHNPGLESRIPYPLRFEDYTDHEFLTMLQFQMKQYYKSGIDIEDGINGLYVRIATGRLGRGRSRDGFGNARALENMFARIRERQSDRLTRQRREGLTPDDYHITKEDLIGPDPLQAILTSDAWTQLQQLTGLKSVKDSVSFMIDLIKTNYERELNEKELVELYAKILADIRMLSNGEVVVKNPSDFIGNVIGQSESNTKAILATTVGKVLIIDEAYMLYPGSSSGGESSTDIFKIAVIDTIVAEVQSVPGEDRCLILIDYEPQMVDMFQNVNPGLTRRFQLSDDFRFEDSSDSELLEILQLKLKRQGLGATQQALSTAIDVLSRLRNGLNLAMVVGGA